MEPTESADSSLVWYEDHFPVGMLIKGSALKHLAEQKLFAVNYALLDDSVIHAAEVDFSEIEDNEVYVIALNTNSGTIRFIQLFTESRVIIETHTKPERRNPPLPPYDMAYAL